ncbi:hypothetical protein M501DRAFT_994171 [Patellaria atrata CBS 101060]|uniref:Mitochondrial adapter protein MCP1 transmembrane domain-containing protein n=1 Tax=Patellaria atrata CBS 101060 TaxID=1346257 RepID=A0A9P4SK34_9PEZI|nr:hypothetical protein M501DRAFT_994171 [Patellaria atrata CBS 101060]
MDTKTPDTPESEGRYMGLQELEPSPVEDTPLEAEKDSYFPSPPSPSPSPKQPTLLSRATTFGLGDHGPAYYLLRIQKYSSYAFTIFAAFHITNTSLIPLLTQSVQASDSYLLLTRPYYQSFPLEPLIVALPLVAHVGSGLALRLYRRNQSAKRYGAESRSDRRLVAWPKVSGTSALGFALTFLVGGHAFINRVLPLWLEGSSSNIGLEYVSHGFAKHPVVSTLGFSTLVGVAAWHAVWGWAKWLRWNPDQVTEGGGQGQLRKKQRWYTINGISALVTVLWMAGGLGVVGRGGEVGGWMGREYDAMYRRIPVVGHWLS